MKRLFLIMLVLMFMAGNVIGADFYPRVTGSDKVYPGISGKSQARRIIYTVETDGRDGSLPANIALDSISKTTSSGLANDSLRGWWLQRIDFIPGSVAIPWSTFRLWSVENEIDILDGAGINIISGSTATSIYPDRTLASISGTTSTAYALQLLTGDEIFDIDMEAETSKPGADARVIFTLFRE